MQLRGSKQAAVAGGAVIAALAIAACSSSSSSSSSSTPASSSGSSAASTSASAATSASGTINAAGSTFQTNFQQAAISAFKSTQPGHHGQLRPRRFQHGPQRPVREHGADRRLGLADPGERAVQGSRGQDGAVLPGAVRPDRDRLQPVGRHRAEARPGRPRPDLPGHDHDLERPGDQGAQPRPEPAEHHDHPRGPLGRLRHHGELLPVPGRRRGQRVEARHRLDHQVAVHGARRQRRQRPGADRQVHPGRHRLRGLLHRHRVQPVAPRRSRTRPATTSRRPPRARPRPRPTSRRRPT